MKWKSKTVSGLSFFLTIFFSRYNFWRKKEKGIPVFLYHRLSKQKTHTGVDKFSVDIETFRHHLDYLNKMGYITTTVENLEKCKGKCVCITFDDGYEDNIHAYPIFKKYGYTATFFIVADWIEKGRSPCGLKMMNWEDIKFLKESGFEIGSHSLSHRKLPLLKTEEKKEEIIDSKKAIEEKIKSSVVSFSYPYGAWNDESKKIVKEYYKKALIIKQKIYKNNNDLFLIPRGFIRKNTDMIDFYLLLTRGRSRI
jgi:peptidoglycan/xylan/chitin deacetylase (PgdA/CDA1 family)